MTLRLHAAIVTAFLGASGAAGAQQANPLDVISQDAVHHPIWRADLTRSR
jgi:hypothetical protein